MDLPLNQRLLLTASLFSLSPPSSLFVSAFKLLAKRKHIIFMPWGQCNVKSSVVPPGSFRGRDIKRSCSWCRCRLLFQQLVPACFLVGLLCRVTSYFTAFLLPSSNCVLRRIFPHDMRLKRTFSPRRGKQSWKGETNLDNICQHVYKFGFTFLVMFTIVVFLLEYWVFSSHNYFFIPRHFLCFPLGKNIFVSLG